MAFRRPVSAVEGIGRRNIYTDYLLLGGILNVRPQLLFCQINVWLVVI